MQKCNKTFIAKTNIVKSNCFISNNVKYGVALKASKKISEKDIASDFNISHNTVNRIINSFFEKYKVNYKHLLKFCVLMSLNLQKMLMGL